MDGGLAEDEFEGDVPDKNPLLMEKPEDVVEISGKMGDEGQMGQRGVVGNTTQYFSQRGYGWMFEVEEDEDDTGPRASLMEELDIDVKDILYKIRCVIWPMGFDRRVLMTNPDFWGPCAVVILYASLLLWGQFKVVSWVLITWLFGSYLVFLLVRVLGGDVSFGQTLGLIGYSLLPLVICVVLFLVLPNDGFIGFLLKTLSTLWSTYSAGSLLVTEEIKHRRYMLMYPVLLLFVYFISLYSGV